MLLNGTGKKMTSCIVWSIPNEVIEEAVKNSLHLETMPVVWAAGIDNAASCVNVVIELDEDDLKSLVENQGDMEISLLGGSGQIQ